MQRSEFRKYRLLCQDENNLKNSNLGFGPTIVPSSNFKALYAVDSKEWQDTQELLFPEFPELVHVFAIDVGIKGTWDETLDAWRSIAESDSI